MSTGDVRRAQLVSPFGVGAMSMLVNGTAVITAGLDHWYPTVKEDPNYEPAEFQTHDWRLEKQLQVSEFRLPPDFRPYFKGGSDTRNTGLKVPALRFPLVHFCTFCRRLEASTPNRTTRMECPDPKHADWKRRPRMAQVPFVMACPKGHLADFPFSEWVHKSLRPTCNKTLRLRSYGGGLDGQVVECECGRRRSLLGIMQGGSKQTEQTLLTRDLAGGQGNEFLCKGAAPWLALDGNGLCGQPVRGALRGAGNIYFPKVESSIYLPVEAGAVPAQVKELLKDPKVQSILEDFHEDAEEDGVDVDPVAMHRKLQRRLPEEVVGDVSVEDVHALYNERFGIGGRAHEEIPAGDVDLLTSDDSWRYPEYEQIRQTPQDDDLTASDPGVHPSLSGLISRVRSVATLRETRALRGFTRLNDTPLGLLEGKQMLRRRTLDREHDWLPAYVVKGEGVYLELDPDELRVWEERPEVQARAQLISDHHAVAASDRGLLMREIRPRFVMMHTLAHLLINELVFACGYSSASLRERLYVSETSGREMAGLLVYTAAGDSEGTMGGLVRMSSPNNLHKVLQASISDATWCSTDPVCMDSGEHGQGTDSCNLAACHGCALVPETSCEEFNRFLDRGLLVGSFKEPDLGFFSGLVR
ncbi:DrmB family protein [Isoptericola sp. NPDC056134]|uniref:DrmB family protein n=1 Tax=Isoptericola sp. NPDC056134 TaxID=3345723 RepID=UPI0035EE6CE8